MTTHDKNEEIKQRFLRDTRNHKMTVVHADGVHRHLHCSSGSLAYYFTITTWPGHLCITGDMGTYVFHRERDMLHEFFNSFKDPCSNTLPINPHYWAEKLQNGCVGGRQQVQDTFMDQAAYKEAAATHFREELDPSEFVDPINADGTFREDDPRLEAFTELIQYIERHITEDKQVDEQIAWEMHNDLMHEFLDGSYFHDGRDCKLEDIFEYRFDYPETTKKFKWHFIWCCYAIAWAQKKWHQYVEGRDQKSHDALVLAGKI